MALPFLNNGAKKKRDDILAIDLGSRATKAIHVQRRGQGLALCSYALLDAPIFDKTVSAELLMEHLKAVVSALNAKTKAVALTVGVGDALVRTVEMPTMPLDDLRLVLKHNSRNYLQQDMSNYVFDCHVIGGGINKPSGGKGAANLQKQKVLVAGAKKQLVDEMMGGARGAGLTVDQIMPCLVGPVNAFEKAMPEVFASETVALVELGFKSSSICILDKGELALSRVVAIGGDRFTNDLSISMKISYAEAEGIKLGMPSEVQSQLEETLIPLGRELRASLDFFEHQHDRSVKHIYITGGSARSEFLVQTLQRELMVECKVLNPVTALHLEVPPQQAAEIAQVAPQLAVAMGAAITSL